MTNTADIPTPVPADGATPRRQRSRTRRFMVRSLALVGIAGFVAFWTWALFFASKEPINRIGDSAWQARAEGICAAVDDQRNELADFREMKEATPELVRERADIVDAATDLLEQMLDDVAAVQPTDPKGQDLIPQWESDYRDYLASRRDFAATLRETGENSAFYEPISEGIPVSERLETFAADNAMASCAPPRDLTR